MPCDNVLFFPIRNATPRRLLEIERLSFVDPWRAEVLRYVLRDKQNGGAIVIDRSSPDRQIAGFVLARCEPTHHELLRLAVHPDHRGRGLGRRLLEFVRRRCALFLRPGVEAFLPETETAGHLFLKHHGFRCVGSSETKHHRRSIYRFSWRIDQEHHAATFRGTYTEA